MIEVPTTRRRRLPPAAGSAHALVVAVALVGALALALGAPATQAARPDANVGAGALALPDRSFLDHRGSSCDFYLDPAGSDSNPGTQAAPWRTLRKAAATLTAGKVGCLNSGTYEETGAAAANSGTQSAPIVLQPAPGSPTRPVVRLAEARPVLRIDRGYWVVDGLEFDLNRKATTGIVFGTSGHHIALRNGYVHDDARGAAIYIAADDVTVEDSEIAKNFHVDPAQDSHGINVFGHAERVLVRGNRIHDNGGDGVQCADEIDEGTTSDAVVPVDLTIEDNRFWTSPENQGRTEQGVDIKSCRQVSIRGSVSPAVDDPNAANQKFYGFKTSSSAAGGGGAMVIHLRARNVLVENNRIWDSCHGVGIGRHDTAYGVPENIVVRRNAMFDLKAIGGSCTGYGIGIQRVVSADLYHNTLDRIAGSAFRFKHGMGTGPASPNVDFFNNIVRDARSFLEIATGEIAGFASDHNLFWSSDGNQNRFTIGPAQSLSSWQSKQNGASVLFADRNSRVSDPLFVPGAGTTDDYYTQAASPARDRALDNTGAARSGAGPDLGFRETYEASGPETRCDTATAGAAWPGEAFGAQSGRFTATLEATPLGAPVAAAVGLSKATAQAWTGMAAIVLFDDVTGTIKARDGGGYTALTAIPYQANATYRIRFVVDLAARRYSAYVTPPGGAEITIGTNLAFRTEQQAVTSLDTRTVAAGIGSLRACRLEISAAPDPSPSTTTVFALGDGADGSTASRELATYIRGQNPDRFFYLGDVYATGTADEFARNYDPAYGALADRTDPVIGNHEYANRNSGYYPYWQQRRGWTSEQAKHRSYVTPEGWQIIAYSSEHDPDAEAAWVSTQMATHPGTCRIVMAHRGRHVVADSEHGDNTSQQAIWSLIANKTAINLVGHNHLYGRLAPIDGVTVLVSGAGKAGLRSLGTQHHTVAASENRVPTATKLVLRRGAADFRQVDKNGTVYDSGTITCAVADPPPLTECLPSSPTPINLRRWLDDAFLDDRFPGSNARIDEIPAGSAGDPVRRSMAAALARLQAGDLGGARASLDAVAAPPYSVACVDQEGLQRPLGLLWEPRTTDPPHGWGTAVWSFAGSREIFVEAPHPKADTDTEAMAITAFARADARALLIAGAHRAAGPGADVAHEDASAFEALHRQLLAGRAGGVVIQFHGFTWEKHPELESAGVKIVVTSAPNPTLSHAIAAAIAPRWHAATEADGLEGTTNVQRASAVRAGLTFVHVEVESGLRRADEGAEVARAVVDAIVQHVDATG